MWTISLVVIVTALAQVHVAIAEDESGFVPVFDGKSFTGWEGNLRWFRIQDGAIVAGGMYEKVPRNEFLCTEKSYENFELRLKVKLIDGKGNAGVQIRTKRIPNHHEVSGYQADVGPGWWGSLYDESRRRRMLAKADPDVLKQTLKPAQWNDYRIRCEGKRVQLWLNGHQTVDYTEEDEGIDTTGIIALQIHSGPPAEVWYKDIRIKVIK